MHRLSPLLRPLFSSMVPPAPRLAAPLRHVPRAAPACGSPTMSSSGPDCCNNGVMISLGECFAINQVVGNGEKRGAIKRFCIPRHGHGYAHPANEQVMRSKNDEDIVCDSKYVLEVTSGKSYSMGTTSKLTDGNGKQDARRRSVGDGHSSDGKVDVSEVEDYENSAEEEEEEEEDISCYDDDHKVPNPLCIFENSSHRDGSIYRCTLEWTEDYRIADCNETRLEAMTRSDPKDCELVGGLCTAHPPGHLFQFFSVKLAKIPMDRGLVELYGYIAVRDCLDPLLNYIVNISRDDPVIMGQGSLIEMSGPKRGIDMYGNALLEYDMRIKTGDREEDDLQLIDGVSLLPDIILCPCNPYTNRIHGDHGAVDITRALLYSAVEATVDVAVSEVTRGSSDLDLSLSSFTSGIDKEIQLFRGAIGEPRRLRRCVVAVVVNDSLHFRFKVGSEEHDCYFKATVHGCSTQHVRTELASISVKVVWSTMPFHFK